MLKFENPFLRIVTRKWAEWAAMIDHCTAHGSKKMATYKS